MKKFLPKKVFSIQYSVFRKRKNGFTLVELLVVISIIAILTVLGIALYGVVQGKARDTKRKVDVDAIIKVYEIKYDALTGKYPVSTAITDSDFVGGVKPKAPESTTANVVSYVEIPTAGGGTTVTVCAGLEGNTNPTACTPSTANCYCKSGAQATTATPGSTSCTTTITPTGTSNCKAVTATGPAITSGQNIYFCPTANVSCNGTSSIAVYTGDYYSAVSGGSATGSVSVYQGGASVTGSVLVSASVRTTNP